MDTMERFDILAARLAHGSLSEEEARELEVLVSEYPKLGERLVEMEEMGVFLKEFAPLLEAAEDAPAAQFPEHRMGQFTTAVWEEFRPNVPARPRFSIVQWLLRHSFSLSFATAVVALAVTTVNLQPAKYLVGKQGAEVQHVIEFGVYNPVTELDYSPEQFLDLFNVDTQQFLSGVGKLNSLATPPAIKPLTFEMADAFEQWKGDALAKNTVARVWVDKDMERLYIMQREGETLEQTVRELPRDSGEREQMIRSTIQSLSQDAVRMQGLAAADTNA